MIANRRLYFPRLVKSTWHLYGYADLYLVQKSSTYQSRAPYATSRQLRSRQTAPEPFAWTIFSDSTSTLARELERLPRNIWRRKEAGGNSPLLVMLLTPTHVSLLKKLDDDLGPQLSTVYPEAHIVDVLIAVVDRIPTVGVDQNTNSATASPNNGREGMSVAFLDLPEAAPDLWAPRQAVSKSETMSIQQRCSISFAVRYGNSPYSLQRLQLPVANTLFVNGSTSTLLTQRWLKDPSRAREPAKMFTLVKEKTLPEQVINLTFPTSTSKWHLESNLHSFLRPITKPRVVAESVGNIIQKMIFDDPVKASPASQELEAVIQKMIDEGETPNGPTVIWALIIPKGVELSYTQINRHALRNGCQLRKVLSGGGGWGVKQGLLSLDPEAEYGPPLAEPQANPPSFREVDESPRMFETLVNPGDTITFFINEVHENTSSETVSSDSDMSHPLHVGSPRMLQFGTVPSTIDTAPAGENELPEALPQEKDVVVRDYFGMLSEHGMSFEGYTNLQKQQSIYSSNSTEQINESIREEGEKSMTIKTKLDAPYTMFTYRFRSKTSSNSGK